ncbi:MAG: flagellar protein FlaG [Betaproteobacteria bacterium]|nr:flagellar protein FlaG [Betaproteobacteria bacterium]
MSSTASVSAAMPSIASAGNRVTPNVVANPQPRSNQTEAVAQQITAARTTNAPSVQETAKVSRETVEAAANKIQSFVSSMSRDLNIFVDSSSGKAVIRVVDPQTNETIRQIPPEESLRLARMVDYLASLLVDQRA